MVPRCFRWLVKPGAWLAFRDEAMAVLAPTAPDSSAQGRIRETLGNNVKKPCALKGRDNSPGVCGAPSGRDFSHLEIPGSRGLDPGLTSGTPLACKALTNGSQLACKALALVSACGAADSAAMARERAGMSSRYFGMRMVMVMPAWAGKFKIQIQMARFARPADAIRRSVFYQV